MLDRRLRNSSRVRRRQCARMRLPPHNEWTIDHRHAGTLGWAAVYLDQAVLADTHAAEHPALGLAARSAQGEDAVGRQRRSQALAGAGGNLLPFERDLD